MANGKQRVLIEGMEDARIIAERAFTMRYPDHTSLFNMTWNVLAKKNVANSENFHRMTSELAVAEAPDIINAELVKVIGIFFETMVTKSPLVREEVLGRLKSVCRKRGEDEHFTEDLANSLAPVLTTERLMLVVEGLRTGPVHEDLDVPETEARQRSNERAQECDISVWENKVQVKRSLAKKVSCREVFFRQGTILYRTFIIMLRYRGKPLPTRWFYTATRRPNPINIERLFDVDLSEDLRYAIRDVEKKLGVSSLYTPDKDQDKDYVCKGEFSFYLVVPMSLARELSMPS